MQILKDADIDEPVIALVSADLHAAHPSLFNNWVNYITEERFDSGKARVSRIEQPYIKCCWQGDLGQQSGRAQGDVHGRNNSVSRRNLSKRSAFGVGV